MEVEMQKFVFWKKIALYKEKRGKWEMIILNIYTFCKNNS